MDRNEGSDPSSTADIMYHGYPSNENIFERCGYVLSYNYDRKGANYVCECLTQDQMVCLKANNQISRRSRKDIATFEEDPDMHHELRPKLADYETEKIKKYEKGHLAAAGDPDMDTELRPKLAGCETEEIKYEKGHLAAAGNHGYNLDAYYNTYRFSNCVPMHTNVNNIIRKLEEQARKLAKSEGKIHIITVPYFHHRRVPNFVREGSKVQVPDAILKLMVHKTKKSAGTYFVRTYFVKNSPDGYKRKIKFENLKYLRGLKFLSKIPLRNIKEEKMTGNEWMKADEFEAFINQSDMNRRILRSAGKI